MIKKFLRRGSRGRNNFQNVSPSAGLEVFADETFFSRRVKKAWGVYLKGFNFTAKHDIFSTLREEKNYPSRIHGRGGENILKIVFSPDPPFKNFLILGI